MPAYQVIRRFKGHGATVRRTAVTMAPGAVPKVTYEIELGGRVFPLLCVHDNDVLHDAYIDAVCRRLDVRFEDVFGH